MVESTSETNPASEPKLTQEQLEDVEKNKDVAAMSYVWILAIVVLYSRKDSLFIQHHARQGTWLFFLSIPVWLIPEVGHYMEFVVLAGMIIGFINAAQGRYHDIPVIGQLAKGTLTLRDIWKKIVAGVVRGVGVLKRGVGMGEKSEGSEPAFASETTAGRKRRVKREERKEESEKMLSSTEQLIENTVASREGNEKRIVKNEVVADGDDISAGVSVPEDVWQSPRSVALQGEHIESESQEMEDVVEDFLREQNNVDELIEKHVQEEESSKSVDVV